MVVLRFALPRSTTSPALLALENGLAAPPFSHSTTRVWAVAVPRATEVAVKSGGAERRDDAVGPDHRAGGRGTLIDPQRVDHVGRRDGVVGGIGAGAGEREGT